MLIFSDNSLQVKRLAAWPQKFHNKLLYEELIRWVQGENIKSYFLRGDEAINNKSPLDGEDFNPEDAELANNAEKYVKKEIDRLKGEKDPDKLSGEVNHNLKSYCEIWGRVGKLGDVLGTLGSHWEN